jgi:hypothetical protein
MVMKKILMLIFVLVIIMGCSHHMQPANQEIEKINARVQVYMPENFLYYQSDHAAVIKSLSFKFKEPVTKLFPPFLNETFTQTNLTNTQTDLGNEQDFMAIPKFEKVTFDSDRTFGHELRVTMSMSFTPAGSNTPIVIKGTGLAQDIYGGKTIYEQELAEKAFADALKELKKNILERKSEFESTGQ